MQENEVTLVVCQEDATVLRGNEQVLVVAIPSSPEVPGGDGGMARGPQELGDLKAHIVIDVEGGQRKN